jgi:hypothetical protein
MPVLHSLALVLALAVPMPSLWSWPVGSYDDPPPVLATFDPPVYRWLSGHRGVDLAAQPGSVVTAAGDGVVAYAGPLAGRGVISIRHAGGLRTTYEPVTAQVSIGVAVRRGQVIGTVQRWPSSHAGCGASACLHWGARHGTSYVDPLSLLAPPRVRLLPGPVGGIDRAHSSPGVSLLVRQPQALDRDVGVALGGRDRGVTQQLLDRAKVSATLE